MPPKSTLGSSASIPKFDPTKPEAYQSASPAFSTSKSWLVCVVVVVVVVLVVESESLGVGERVGACGLPRGPLLLDGLGDLVGGAVGVPGQADAGDAGHQVHGVGEAGVPAPDQGHADEQEAADEGAGDRRDATDHGDEQHRQAGLGAAVEEGEVSAADAGRLPHGQQRSAQPGDASVSREENALPGRNPR